MRIHGMNGTREHKAWSEAKQRCHNPSNSKFKWYGERGISVCAEWVNDFVAFYEHIGPCPDGMSLDRIDVNGDYAPGNVRWATRAEQVNNRRSNRKVTVGGETMNMTEAAQRYGVSVATLWARLEAGWPDEKAATQPTRPMRRSQEASRRMEAKA